MAAFNARKHNYIALAVQVTGKALPEITTIAANQNTFFGKALSELLMSGESITVDDKQYYVISSASVVGRKYGNAAIIKKLLKESVATCHFTDFDVPAKILLEKMKGHKYAAV